MARLTSTDDLRRVIAEPRPATRSKILEALGQRPASKAEAVAKWRQIRRERDDNGREYSHSKDRHSWLLSKAALV